VIPIPTRATTTRGWARWGGGGQDLGTAYVVVAEASCPVICHSRPVLREHLTQILMEAFRSPGGPPLPLAPPCNRQRPFFVAGDRQGSSVCETESFINTALGKWGQIERRLTGRNKWT